MPDVLTLHMLLIFFMLSQKVIGNNPHNFSEKRFPVDRSRRTCYIFLVKDLSERIGKETKNMISYEVMTR